MNTYTKKERNSYLVGLTGQTVIYAIIMSLAYYFQFTLLIPAMAVSVILTGNQIWNAFKDPFMGTIMDRTRSKWGKARPWLLFAPLPTGIFTILIFVNGIYDPAQAMAGRNLPIVIWAAASYFLWGLAYTAGDVPLHSLPALMTEDKSDRTKIISMKTIAGMIGFLGIAVQPLALQVGQSFADGTRGTQQYCRHFNQACTAKMAGRSKSQNKRINLGGSFGSRPFVSRRIGLLKKFLSITLDMPSRMCYNSRVNKTRHKEVRP